MATLDAKPPLFPGTGPIGAATHTKTQTTLTTGSMQLTTLALLFVFFFFAMFPEQLILLIRHELGN